MRKILTEVESQMIAILLNPDANVLSMHIDYHDPFVNRIRFSYGENRVYLHKLLELHDLGEALYHPHPWPSVIRILRGTYEMGIGHSATDDMPATDCTLEIGAGTVYEMLEEDAWHYVKPLGGSVFSLMVTGPRNNRKMPIEPQKDFRPLTKDEFMEILEVVESYYDISLPKKDIYTVSLANSK